MDSSNNPPSKKVNTSNMEEFLQALRDIQNINVDMVMAHLSQSSKQTNQDVSETLMAHSCHALESQRKETERLRKKLEEEKVFRQEYLQVFGRKEIKDVNKTIDHMVDEIQRLQRENTKLDEKNKSLEEELRKAITEKDNAMTRLRRQMGNQVTEDTTCIANMSDQNRPYKLEKRYQELYDTQWADAFEMLTKTQRQNDKNAIEMLFKVLIECHNFAKMRAERQMNELVRMIYGDPTVKVGDAIKRQLKNARKLMYVAEDQNSKLIQECEGYMIGKVRYLYEKEMKKYLIECFQICWLMALQDPPCVLDKEMKYAENFDTSLYNHFITSGTRVDFVVLPPILLHEGGPVIAKGVAGSIRENTEQFKTYRNVRNVEGTIGIREQPIGGATEHYPVKLSSTTTRPLTSDGRINTTLPQTTTPSSSSLATIRNMYPLSMGNQQSTIEMSRSTPTSYQTELVGTSYKPNTNTDYGGSHFTIGSTPNANARESENKPTPGQQGIISYTGGPSAMTERVSMNEAKQSQEFISPHAGSARTSYEDDKTSQLHHSTARFENETRGHLSATGQTGKPIHLYKRGNVHGYDPLQEYEQNEFVGFIHMYDREGESVTRTHFFNKYDKYLALYQELLQQSFGGN